MTDDTPGTYDREHFERDAAMSELVAAVIVAMEQLDGGVRPNIVLAYIRGAVERYKERVGT